MSTALRAPTLTLPTGADDLTHILGPGNYRRLARVVGVTHGHVSRVLRGRIGASFDVAQRIADAAGITVDELRAHIDAVAPDTATARRTHRRG